MTAIDPDVIGRIRKLFALARDAGATEAEAALALERASDLLLKHNLSADAVSSETAAESVTEDGVRLGRRDSWRHRLMIVLAKHNLCDCFYSGDRVVIIGRPTNIAVTREMFDWISPQLMSIAEQEYRAYLTNIDDEELDNRGGMWCPDCEKWRHGEDVQRGGRCYYCETRMLGTPRVHGRTWKTNFMRGILQRIRNRLYEQRQSQETRSARPSVTIAVADTSSEVRALVVRTNLEVDSYTKRHHPDLITRRRRESGYHGGAIQRGMTRGADVSLGGNRLSSDSRPRLGGI